MLTSFRGLMAVSLAAAGLTIATPALAQSEDEAASAFTTSANVALTTDYRFRGVSLSGVSESWPAPAAQVVVA